jgi:hypothetical protein
MSIRHRLQPTSVSPASAASPVEGVAVSGDELLARIERLSAQLAVAKAELRAAEERVEAFARQDAAAHELAAEVQQLRDVALERDALLDANADLRRQLEGMWFQLRTAEADHAQAHAGGSRGLLGRVGSRG